MTRFGTCAMAALAGLLLGSAPALAGDWQWKLPPHIPEPRIPADNPMSAAKVALGRRLFYDKRLSADGTIACGSCHKQELAFTDGRAVSSGITGELTHRNALGVANGAWHATYNWANPAIVSLERQAEIPLFSQDPVEMGVTDANRQDILDRLGGDPIYPPLFSDAFPDLPQPISMASVIKALAAFQRSIISVDSRFDRFVQGKDELSVSEKRGMELFFGEKAECHHCHGSFNFNDQVVRKNSRLIEAVFHNNGLYNISGTGAYPYPNRGLYEITGKPEDMGAFRAPGLRNVEVTAPYMHDGSIGSLEEVMDQYARGGRLIVSGPLSGDGRMNPYRSSLIGRIDLSEEDKQDLIAFLRTLTDQTLLGDRNLSDPWEQK